MFRQIVRWTIVFMLALIVVLHPERPYAQDRAGTLQGVVKNSSGAPLAGAFVKMKNAERRLTFMVITRAQGRYSVNALPVGKYVVQGVGGDYQSDLSAPVDVAPGKPVTVDLSLTVARAPQLAGAWPGRRPGEQLHDYPMERASRSSRRNVPSAAMMRSGSSEPDLIGNGGKKLSLICDFTRMARRLQKT